MVKYGMKIDVKYLNYCIKKFKGEDIKNEKVKKANNSYINGNINIF